MNTITIDAGRLTVEPTGLNKLWSFRRRIQVPLGHVRGATHDPGAATEAKGLRAPGLAIPGKFAGTFHRDGDRTFYNVTGRANTVVVELADEEFRRLVLTVDDPRAVVTAINAAIG